MSRENENICRFIKIYSRVVAAQEREAGQIGGQAIRGRSGVDGRQRRRDKLVGAATARGGQQVPEGCKCGDQVVRPRDGRRNRVRPTISQVVPGRRMRRLLRRRQTLRPGLLADRVRVAVGCVRRQCRWFPTRRESCQKRSGK